MDRPAGPRLPARRRSNRSERRPALDRRPELPASGARSWPGRRQAGRDARPVNDSWIAACCLTYELPLATLNIGHFDDFVEFEGLRLIQP